MSLRNTNFENWRLSRIEEEIERLSFSSQDTSADDGSCSPRSAEGTLERRGCPKVQCKDDGIYSCTALGMTGQGNASKEEENSKDALRFIKEKYDSLGKVKVKKPSAEVAQQVMTSTEGDQLQRHEAVDQLQDTSRPSAPSLIVDNSEIVRAREFQEQLQPASAADPVACFVRSNEKSPTRITEQELYQVEMFYRSHKTSVFMCLCQATLYLSDPIRNSSICPLNPPEDINQSRGRRSGPPEKKQVVSWTLVKSGIPVLLLDSGESRRQRRLNLVLAERGTGFALWRDQIDCLSNYDAPSITFHTMQLSNDHSKLIGLRFEDIASASDFLQQIRRLTSDTDDPLLSLASTADDNRRRAKKTKKSTETVKGKAVTKADISQPCCFTHITKLDQSDGSNLLLRGQTTEYTAITTTRNSPRSGSGDRHKVKLKP